MGGGANPSLSPLSSVGFFFSLSLILSPLRNSTRKTHFFCLFLFDPKTPPLPKRGEAKLSRDENGETPPSLRKAEKKDRSKVAAPLFFASAQKEKKQTPPQTSFFFKRGQRPPKRKAPGSICLFPELSLSLPTLSVTIKTQAKKGWGHLSSEELLFSVPSFCSFLKLGFWVFFSKENQRAAGSKRHARPRREYGNLNHPLLFLEHK